MKGQRLEVAILFMYCTITAGDLLEAATLKKDEKILLHIRGKDCVAIEVHYHANCYRKYTQDVANKKRKESQMLSTEAAHVSIEDDVYKKFCDEFVVKKIVNGKEVLRMTRLTRTLNDMYLKEDIKIVLRNNQLKARLMKDFPHLTFYANKKNLSEIVYIDSLSAEDFLENYSSSVTDDSSTSSESEEPATRPFVENPVRTLYNAGLQLKRDLLEHPGLLCNWPPTVDDMNIHIAKSVIPISLFNFFSWIVGASEEPLLDDYVDVSNEAVPKLLSICQDLVYLASNGRKLTPKSLCLGLTTRHLNGSSQLLTLLNRFGHCSSRDTIMGYETGLAQLQLTRMKEIPPGFSKKTQVLVWDNIDFGEETLSGKATTHHTNGIMIQNSTEVVGEVFTEEVSISKRQRAFKPQPVPLIPYQLGKKKGPMNLTAFVEDVSASDILKRANDIDIFTRYSNSEKLLIPSWTGFNVQIRREDCLQPSNIHYLPVIEASPTDMSTVNTILERSSDMADRMELKHIILVFDQAIYAKAQQVRWKNRDMTEKFIIRLGEFHTAMSFMAIIGKRFKDAGLQDILIESEVVAQGSINGVISGHHYNRSIRAHKLLFEALQRLRLRSFFSLLTDIESSLYMDNMEIFQEMYSSEEIQQLLDSKEFTELQAAYNDFVMRKSEECQTFKFWSSYIDMVGLLLTFIRATRESDWSLHLTAVHSMMPFYFAYDRTNYARYLPIYWIEMVKLNETHPDIDKEMFQSGQWTVQRQSDNPFSSIACDQAIEQTCNRNSKTKGGIIGMTMNRGAVQRWILSQPQRAAIARLCESMVELPKTSRQKRGLNKTLIHKDEEDIKSLISTIDSMINPFDGTSEGLTRLSSGVVATDIVTNDLMEAKAKGKAELDNYIKDRIVDKKTDVFAPIKSLKLKTFSDNFKTKQGKSTEKNPMLNSDRNFFGRLLVIGQSRQLDLRDILSYSLGSVSFPLADSDGGLAKTNKAALLTILEKSTDSIQTVLPESESVALLIDGMALIQAITNIPATFSELSDMIMCQIVHLARVYKAKRVDFVTDRYPDMSIKNAERDRRDHGGSEKIKIYGKDQPTPKQWKKFLSNGDNKEHLIEFLFCTWREMDVSSFTSSLDIFFGHGAECRLFSIQNNILEISDVKSLECDHEEADTRLILHAEHASETCCTIVIRSPDTDVAV